MSINLSSSKAILHRKVETIKWVLKQSILELFCLGQWLIKIEIQQYTSQQNYTQSVTSSSTSNISNR